MVQQPGSATARGAADLELDPAVMLSLRDLLPTVAGQTVAAVIVEVPSYAGALTGAMGENIEAAVQMALAGFLRLASSTRESDPSTPLGPTLEGAYALGRGEARSGRSMDALLAAYRVGARVAWREMAAAAVSAGASSATLGQFAELVFAYIDELSAASVAGHTDELSTSGRVRERYLERLAHQLLSGAGEETLRESAERADWQVPTTLTVVLLAAAQARGAVSMLDGSTLIAGEELPELPGGGERALLLVPDVHGRDRQHLLRVMRGRHAVVGPARPWTLSRTSYLRALQAVQLGLVAAEPDVALDTEEVLPALVLGADPEAIADLRARALAPLAAVRPGPAARLQETLRSWLLHQGRREEVAADLHVHPQTVRYRMGQVRELFGGRLDDPRSVLELVLALGPLDP